MGDALSLASRKIAERPTQLRIVLVCHWQQQQHYAALQQENALHYRSLFYCTTTRQTRRTNVWLKCTTERQSEPHPQRAGAHQCRLWSFFHKQTHTHTHSLTHSHTHSLARSLTHGETTITMVHVMSRLNFRSVAHLPRPFSSRFLYASSLADLRSLWLGARQMHTVGHKILAVSAICIGSL